MEERLKMLFYFLGENGNKSVWIIKTTAVVENTMISSVIASVSSMEGSLAYHLCKNRMHSASLCNTRGGTPIAWVSREGMNFSEWIFSPFFSAKGEVNFDVKFWWKFPRAMFYRVWVWIGKRQKRYEKRKVSRKFHSWRWLFVLDSYLKRDAMESWKTGQAQRKEIEPHGTRRDGWPHPNKNKANQKTTIKRKG